MTKVVHTEKAPAAIGPYVQAVDLGNLVLTSGQIPVNPATGEVPKDIVAQARQSLENVKAIIEQAGLTVADIVKTTVFVKDLNDFAAVNQLTVLQSDYNRRPDIVLFVNGLPLVVIELPKDVGLEIEAIAVRA